MISLKGYVHLYIKINNFIELNLNQIDHKNSLFLLF